MIRAQVKDWFNEKDAMEAFVHEKKMPNTEGCDELCRLINS
jgi:hypothetical protein